MKSMNSLVLRKFVHDLWFYFFFVRAVGPKNAIKSFKCKAPVCVRRTTVQEVFFKCICSCILKVQLVAPYSSSSYDKIAQEIVLQIRHQLFLVQFE